MPELPEVETVRRTLEPRLLGRRILAFEALWPKSLAGSKETLENLAQNLKSKLVFSLKRRGKLLLVLLADEAKIQNCTQAENVEPDLILAFHLKMTGQVLIKPTGTKPGRHTRLVFTLDQGLLFFDDMRKFGFCRVMLPEELEQWSFWKNLGPEPLEINDKTFGQCFCKLANPAQLLTGKIKNVLMDQKIIAGVGNIYADEALFRAGIKPDLPVNKLSPSRLKKLHKQLQAVLNDGLLAGGSSIRDYRDANGESGSFQENFNVYGKRGQPCPVCGEALEHMKLAGRSTVFCKCCQK